MITITDISFWQSTLNAVTMKQRSAGVILRAGQGAWDDIKFNDFRAACKSSNLPYGAYWFYDNRYAPKAQAELFASILGSDKPPLGCWLDLEHSVSGSYWSWQAWREFIDHFRKIYSPAYFGIYTRASYIDIYMPSSQYGYFGAMPLWVAHYGASKPTLPKAWSDWVFWQYSDKGDGKAHGVGSTYIDMNHFNGDENKFNNLFKTNVPPTQTDYQIIRRYDSDVYLYTADPKLVHVSDPNGLLRTSTAAIRAGAKVAINGDGWNLTGAPVLPLSLSYSSGKAAQANQLEFRPFLNINKSGVARIGHTGKTDLYNTVSGTRYLVQNSIIPPYLFGTDSQYVVKHPRTAVGISSGKLVLCVVDGRTSQSAGVTLANLALIMLEFGCQDAIELDGGGSSTFWYNGAVRNVLSDGAERWVINHILVGDSIMAAGKAKEKLGKTSTIRNQPDVSGAKVGSVSPYSIIDFVDIVLGKFQPLDSWLDLGNNRFVNLKVGGVWYYDILNNPTPDPEPDPEPPPAPLPTVAVLVDMYPEGRRVVITSEFDMSDWVVVANGRTFVPPKDG